MNIPESIRLHIGSRSYVLDEVGMSSSQVRCFEDMVLKAEERSEEADNEYAMLAWLADKLPVPRILSFARDKEHQFLLMSRMEGDMACSPYYLEHPDDLISLLARGLKMLWNVDSVLCPHSSRLEHKLRLAADRVRHGVCSLDNAEPDTCKAFASAKELLRWLENNRPVEKEEDLVFSHGDYCLPNIFLSPGRVEGFIDLGRSGIADKYQDIALCYRSLCHNFDGRYTNGVRYSANPDRLFEELGMAPDWEKIRYYILLDELF